MKKRLLAMLILAAALCSALASAASASYGAVRVYIDGRLIKFSADPVTVNYTTYVPMAGLCSLLYDIEAGWDRDSGVLTVVGDGLEITAGEDDVYLTANGRCLYVKDGLFKKNGVIFAPVRTICEIFNSKVSWDAKKNSVYITSGSGLLKPGSEFYGSEDLTWLSRVIQAESGGESLLGKIAVGNVVLNRVKSDQYPDTVYGVIFDHRYGVVQFTPTATGAIYNRPSKESVVGAKLALEGADVAGESLYFFGKSVSSSWIRRSLTFVSNIGNHNFYM